MRGQDTSILDFCFEETYGDLSPGSKKLLISAALFDAPATLEEMAMIAQMPYRQAARCIEPLVRLSLVNENLDDTREVQVYSLLPLTRIFVEKQAKGLADFYESAKQCLTLYHLRRQQLLSGELDIKSIDESKAVTQLEHIAVGLADQAEQEYQKDHCQKAITLLKEAEVLAPGLAYIQQRLAYTERREGHTQSAREYYQRSVELDHANAEYIRHWASLEAKVGQYDKAIELFKEAMMLDATDMRSRHGLANALLRHAQKLTKIPGQSHEAREALTEALNIIEVGFESHPAETKGDPIWWELQARILEQLGRPRQALTVCETGLRLGHEPKLARLANMLRDKLDRR